MIALPPVALSLTHTVTEIGAVVAVAGLLAIAVLTLLFFTQGKEIRRLKEWAGRAPERAEELAQAQRAAAAATPAAVPAKPVLPAGRIGSVRPIPRATPLVARAAADGEQGDNVAAPAGPPTQIDPGPQSPAESVEPLVANAAPADAQTPAATPAVAPAADQAPVAGSPESAPAIAASAPQAPAVGAAEIPPLAATTAATVAGAAAHQGEPADAGLATGPADRSREEIAASGEGTPAQEDGSQSAEPEAQAAEPDAVPAPATAAAIDRAAVGEPEEALGQHGIAAARLSSPTPAIAEPADEEEDLAGAGAAAVGGVAVAAVAEAAGAQARPRFPTPPMHGGRIPEDTGDLPDGGPEHSAGQPNGHGPGDRELPNPSEFRFLRDEPRSPARSRRLILAGVAAVVIVAIAVILATSGGGTSTKSAASTAARHATAAAAAAETSPAQLHLVVLNSTEISGLAHRLAGRLQEQGYRRAEALSGQPPGSYTTTVVEYAPGYSSEAERIGRALAVEAGAVKPIEGATSTLAKGAPVVVIASGTGAGTSESATTSASSGTSGAAGTESGGSEGGGAAAGEGGVESGTGAPGG